MGDTKKAPVLEKAELLCGCPDQTLAWYRSTQIPSLGDRTAEQMVKDGQADAVLAYLERVAEGGYS